MAAQNRVQRGLLQEIINFGRARTSRLIVRTTNQEGPSGEGTETTDRGARRRPGRGRRVRNYLGDISARGPARSQIGGDGCNGLRGIARGDG